MGGANDSPTGSDVDAESGTGNGGGSAEVPGEDGFGENLATTNDLDETPDPLDLNSGNYITGAKLYYLTGSNPDDKVEISSDTTIPDNATTFELSVDYANVPSQEVLNHHGASVSFQLPDPLSNPQFTSANVTDDNTPPKVVGTISAEPGTNLITIKFTPEHLAGNESTVVQGNFTFTCSIDQTKRGSDTSIKIGNAEIPLKFQKHTGSETGDLRIEKSEPQYFAGDDPTKEGYLQYTLTVQTGDQEMPEVRVEDSVTSGGASNYVTGYLLSNDTGTAFSGEPLSSGTVQLVDNGSVTVNSRTSMTWNLGTLPANTTKTLTYRLKLNDNYVGLYNHTPLGNTATVFSGEYNHGSQQKTFTPTVGASVEKTAGDPHDNQDGTYTIKQTVKIKANNDNTWPIRNLKIADDLGRSYSDKQDHASSTNDPDFIALNGNAKFSNFVVTEIDQSGTRTTLNIENPHTNANGNSSTNPDIRYRGDDNSTYNPRFDMYVGDAAPGRTLEVTYDIIVNKKLFTSRNGSWTIGNTVKANTDDQKGSNFGGNTQVGQASIKKAIGTQTWDRKVMGTPLVASTTQIADNGEEATIPKGAVMYKVLVNERGEWNVLGATLKDQLGANMQYVGYLQVSQYAGNTSIAENATDSSAIETIESGTATKSVYEDLSNSTRVTKATNTDGQESISFKLGDLGFTDERAAYVLTYYAVPTSTAQQTQRQIKVTNDFTVSGSVVGPGETAPINMDPVTAHAEDLISGDSNLAASKSAWYFDYPSNTAYWVATLSGDKVPKGLALKDVPAGNSNNGRVVGAYVGTAGNDGNLASVYRSLSDLQASPLGLTTLTQGADYTVSGDTITFSRDITLSENEKLYVIMSSNRNLGGSIDKRGIYTLQNKLQLKEANESEFRDVNTASLTTLGGGDIFKDLGQVITRDASGNWHVVQGGQSKNGPTDLLTSKVTQAGTYIEWRIKANMLPDLSDTIAVTDTLPEGVEPVYVRYFQAGSGVIDDAPTMPVIEGAAGTDIGVGTNGESDVAHAYYDSSMRQIRFNVGNLKRIAASSSDYAASENHNSLEVQVLVRVTDDSILYGSEKAKATFTNTVSAADTNGVSIGEDTSPVTVTGGTISKSAGTLSQGVLPFTINVNPNGENLGDTNTLTVVDELTAPLEYDMASIKVTNTADGQAVDGVTIKDDGTFEENGTKWHRLLFEVPNGKALTISYNTILYARPNQDFTYSNKAYWSGHPDQGSEQSRQLYNRVDSTSTSSAPAQITVVKRDAQNANVMVAGAKFALQEVVWSDSANGGSGGWTDAENSPAKQATTGNDGKATFVGGLKYNAVYKLTETKAPNGYVVNTTPRYIAIAKNESQDKGDTSYLDNAAVYASHGATVQYSGYEYTAQVADERGTTNIEATKQWNDSDNQDGIRPASVDLTLTGKVGNDVVYSNKKTVTIGSDWHCAWNGLQVLGQNGQAIDYSVAETNASQVNGKDVMTGDRASGYSTQVTGDAAMGFVVTNTHTPETTSVSVAKEWDDANDQDGIRPASVEVQLKANGTATGEPVTLSADKGWSHTWSGLAKKSGGEDIVYTVEEAKTDIVTDSQDGHGTYKSEVTGSAAGGFTITNTHTPDKTSLMVTKKWDDASDQDGVRPASVEVWLVKNEVRTGQSVTLNEENNWTATFSGLDVNARGSKVTYTLSEDVSGDVAKRYPTATTTFNDAHTEATITNTHTPETTDVSVTKTWEDNNNQDGKRPDKVTVHLLADGERTGDPVTLDAAHGWSYTWSGLAKKSKGTDITYAVEEEPVKGYESTYSTDAKSGLVVTNAHAPEKVTVSGAKHWEDANDQDGIRPENVTVRLMRTNEDGTASAAKDENGQDVTQVVSAATNWEYTFANLDKFENGQEIRYYVVEDPVEGYTTSYDGNDITNTHTPATVNIPVEKQWDDANNQDGIRPDKVTVRLLRDGMNTGKSMVLSADNDWKGTFENLPANRGGKPNIYTIAEDEADSNGYVTTYDGNALAGYTVTNTHAPATTNVSVTKKWMDVNNEDGIRPDKITVRLVKTVPDGLTSSTSVVTEQELTAANQSAGDPNVWSWTFTDLPQYEGGRKIRYSVAEVHTDVVTGTDGPGTYKIEMSGTPDKGFTITNRHTPKTPSDGSGNSNGNGGPNRNSEPSGGSSEGGPSAGGTAQPAGETGTTPSGTPSPAATLAQTGDAPWPEAVAALLVAALVLVGIGLTLKRRKNRS